MSKRIAKFGLLLMLSGAVVLVFLLVFFSPLSAPADALASHVWKSALMAMLMGLVILFGATVWDTLSL